MKSFIRTKQVVFLLLAAVIALCGTIAFSPPKLAQAASSPVEVTFRNPNTGQMLSQLDPWYKITALSDLDLAKLKIRYFYSINGERPQSYAIDYATINTNSITGSFAKISPAYTKADYWFELGFNGGTLAAGQNAEVNSRIYKDDGSRYDQSLNYSFAGADALSTYISWDYIAVYYDGVLVQGTPPTEIGVPVVPEEPDPTPEPEITPEPTAPPAQGNDDAPVNNGSISLQMKNGSPNHPNTIYAWYKLFNNTGASIDLSRITLRYYYTDDGNTNQVLECDNFMDETSAARGNQNVFATTGSALGYYEMGFNPGAGSVSAGGFVQVDTRMHDVSWANYNQQNDFSYHGTDAFINWTKVAVFLDGILVWGGENQTSPNNPDAEYSLQVNTNNHGTVSLNSGTYSPGQTFNFSITPEDGYSLKEIVAPEGCISLTDDNRYVFVMPNQATMVTFVFAPLSSLELVRAGTEYIQTIAPVSGVALPVINSVTIADRTDGVELSISDYSCDPSGEAFFFWESGYGVFLEKSADCVEVQFQPYSGTAHRKVPVTAWIGDGLGHVGKYQIWIDGRE